ncbi:MAG: DUF4302 domain-containing protein [Dysgonamonadaceae bacterium]|jgi:hypothetical protein|nr:DUF4302 domain-containing protein [Dysgonamonadaceae bacterium]
MKKIFLMLALMLGVLASCDKKMDAVFDEPADVRLQEAIDHYRNTLTSAPNGWIFTMNTKLGGVYRFWLSFTEDGRVIMLSDANSEYASTIKESSYRITALQTVLLTFDTGNYLTQLHDPEAAVSGGTEGQGMGADIDFYFISEDNGVFNMLGRFNSNAATLKPATPAEARVIVNGAFYDAQTLLTEYSMSMIYSVVSIEGVDIHVTFAPRQTAVEYLDDNGNLVNAVYNSYVDVDGLANGESNGTVYISTPFTVKGKEIIKFEWDSGENNYVAVSADGSTYKLIDNRKPTYSITSVFGVDKTFNALQTVKSQLEGSITEPFLSRFNEIGDLLKQSTYKSYGPELVYMNMRLVLGSSLSSIPGIGSSWTVLEITFRTRLTGYYNYEYSPKFYWKVNIDSKGIYTFTDRINGTTSIEAEVGSAFVKMFAFLENNYFVLDWVSNRTAGSTAMLGGFYASDANGEKSDDFTCGILMRN